MSLDHALQVGDSLCVRVLSVPCSQRLTDIQPDLVRTTGAYAVLGEQEQYMGLVNAREVALFPNRIFADLITRRQPPPLSTDTALGVALTLFNQDKVDYLAVLDDQGRYYGAISRFSLFNTLLNHEHQLLLERSTLVDQLMVELSHHKIAETIFNTTSEGIMVTDANLVIQQVNPAFSKTTGYAPEEAVGQTPHLLSSGRHDKTFYEDMWQSISTQNQWQGEIWNRRKNGEIYPEWLTINRVSTSEEEGIRYVGVFSDISLHKDLENTLQRLAYYDSLTGLPNRTLFRDRLDFLITNRKHDESNSKVALVFIDLDNFKYINDALGHQIGDAVLVEIGKRLRDAMCESDTVARFGGDEFAALIAQYESEASLAHCVRKIFDHLNGHILIEGHEVFVSASIGVAQYPQDASDCDGLLQLADIAMYRAKDSGREQISYYAPEMNRKVVDRLKIENALRNAFENNQFWLAWQPQIDLKTERIIGVEVLMRCSAPELEGIGPDTFIPIAEENGLIVLLGEWALKKAVADALEYLLPVVDRGFRVAVNLSPAQLNKSTIDLVLPMAKALMEQNMVLEIEMTESVLMKDVTHAIGYLQTMAEFGIEFSVDDFGTGYSNLSRLADLPLHRLKIDKSFIQKMADAEHRMSQMIQAIIDMGHALEIKVLAEGIETLEQKQALSELGCDEAQGYFYAKPMKLEEFCTRLQKQAALNE